MKRYLVIASLALLLGCASTASDAGYGNVTMRLVMGNTPVEGAPVFFFTAEGDLLGRTFTRADGAATYAMHDGGSAVVLFEDDNAHYRFGRYVLSVEAGDEITTQLLGAHGYVPSSNEYDRSDLTITLPSSALGTDEAVYVGCAAGRNATNTVSLAIDGATPRYCVRNNQITVTALSWDASGIAQSWATADPDVGTIELPSWTAASEIKVLAGRLDASVQRVSAAVQPVIHGTRHAPYQGEGPASDYHRLVDGPFFSPFTRTRTSPTLPATVLRLPAPPFADLLEVYAGTYPTTQLPVSDYRIAGRFESVDTIAAMLDLSSALPAPTGFVLDLTTQPAHIRWSAGFQNADYGEVTWVWGDDSSTQSLAAPTNVRIINLPTSESELVIPELPASYSGWTPSRGVYRVMFRDDDRFDGYTDYKRHDGKPPELETTYRESGSLAQSPVGP